MRPTRHPARLARRAGAAVTALALAASLTACGGDDEKKKSAADRGVDLGGKTIPAEKFVDVYAAALEKATTARFTLSVEGPASSDVEGVMDFSTDPPSSRMTLTDPTTNRSQELVMANDAIYVQAPDGTYVSAPQGAADVGGNALDPGALLEQFGDAIVEASSHGLTDVDGDTVEHYRAALDGPTITGADAIEETAAPEFEAPETIVLDAYFGDGLLRRIELDLGEAAGTIVVTYSDWGKPKRVRAPKPSQVRAPGPAKTDGKKDKNDEQDDE